jgi:hypothetical protein
MPILSEIATPNRNGVAKNVFRMSLSPLTFKIRYPGLPGVLISESISAILDWRAFGRCGFGLFGAIPIAGEY